MRFNSRKAAFFLLDALMGGRVRGHLDDLRRFSALNKIEQEQLVAERLARLLRHASQTADHYRAWRGVGDLSAWPVLSKRQFQENPGNFLSDAYRGKRLVEKSTSGSYGTPMRVLFSHDKFARRNAEVIHFNRFAGLDVGDPYLHASSDKKSKLHLWRKNTIIIDASIMNADWFRRMTRILQQNPGRVFVGVSSVIIALAEYARTHAEPGSIRLAAVISVAEPLPDKIRQVMEDVFQCPVFNRYASTETGVLAFSSRSDHDLSVNRASYIVELLAQSEDRPAREGELGRVVVTDLFSYAMPLIRYDIGDLAMARSYSRFGASRVSKIEGRVVETIYDTTGSRVSWAVMYDILSEMENVIQYQFIQRAKTSYELILIKRNKAELVETNQTSREFKRILGAGANIAFNFVDSIPALSSGKRPMLMNTTTKEPV